MGVNRDADGDECFHDLLDFMDALQPWAEEGAPVPRGRFLATAKEMVARGEVVVTPLHEFELAKEDFGKLVEFLLATYLDGSEDGGLKELPLDFRGEKE